MARAVLRSIRVLRENGRFALRAVRANRLRSALTMLGIVIGTLTVIVMVAIVQGFQQAVVASMTSFGATLVQFQKFEPRFGGGRQPPEYERTRRDLTLDDALAIRDLCPSIRAVSPERYLFEFNDPPEVKADGKLANSPLIVGVYPDYMIANNHFADDGRFISDADVRHATQVAVIGPDVVDALFPMRDPIGGRIQVSGRDYRVVGVLENKGSTMGGSSNNFVLVPLSTFDRQFPWVKHGGDTIHIATIPWKSEWVERAVEEGRAVLRARRNLRPAEPDDFAIYTPDKLLAQTAAIRGAIGLVMIFIASVSLVVGGVGVMNIMLVAVSERTREIGTRKALGARRRDIQLQFLTEAATLSGLGGAIGVGLGLAVVAAVSATGILPAAAPGWAIVLGLGVSVVIGVFFGYYPASRASALAPIEALRHE